MGKMIKYYATYGNGVTKEIAAADLESALLDPFTLYVTTESDDYQLEELDYGNPE